MSRPYNSRFVYDNFKEGLDYVVHSNDKDSNVLIASIHGGCIEPGTSQIAHALAKQNNYNLFDFQGIMSGGWKPNWQMRVGSKEFQHPNLTCLLNKSDVVIALHAVWDDDVIYVGGINIELNQLITSSLQMYGFNAIPAFGKKSKRTGKPIDGTNPFNFVNHARFAGVQLELGNPIRDRLFYIKDKIIYYDVQDFVQMNKLVMAISEPIRFYTGLKNQKKVVVNGSNCFARKKRKVDFRSNLAVIGSKS